ncbi:MAG TPA: glycosyltransferase family 2 protein [Kiritimatiellia bacterium]|jgi:glycosyltransferase involved in cell wall biosynthesis|nr:glycosyltransferase family 2 protein [Kiritimatiellia bacterium]HPW74824.1 glycosyltransferase family 2 protein [Kiritimatiellia bacterium]HRU18726.1 glycosyltransferase family 2 protein [Kiritimatiellia bacterium]
MLISLVLLTWNRYRFLDLCLASLFANLSGAFDYQILLLDNGSTDLTPQVLNRYRNKPGVTLLANAENRGLSAYKTLFNKAKGKIIIEVDDDILDFPKDFDQIMVDYLAAYPDYGFLALNVIQDERTNGAKPDPSHYAEDTRGNKTVEQGPAGGWCAGFRRKDYRAIWLPFNLIPLSMKRCEDGTLTALFRRLRGLKAGVIREAVCLHACGPYYAQQYGQTEREIQKYMAAGLTELADSYIQTQKGV